MDASVIQLAVALAVVVAFAFGLLRLDRRVLGGPQPLRRRSARPRRRRSTRRARRRRDAPPEPVCARRPLQLVAADLRRLSRELAAVPSGAPLVRWQALWAAYDRVLAEAAELLDVTHTLPGTPIGTPRDIERLRVVCALEGAGLRVQD